MKRSSARDFWVRMSILGCLAGILYSSWPLGYLLNPGVNQSALASALEAIHQPYNWVFIAGDASSGLLIILICWLLWRYYRSAKQRLFLKLVLVNVTVFALGTIAGALLPERCLPGQAGCLAWQHNPLLLIHGIFSILASFCLFLALLFIWWQNRTLLLSGIMVGYIVFSLLSLYEAVGPTQSNFSQHYYITLCGLGIALIPYGVHLAFRGEEMSEPRKKSTP